MCQSRLVLIIFQDVSSLKELYLITKPITRSSFQTSTMPDLSNVIAIFKEDLGYRLLSCESHLSCKNYGMC